MVFLYTCYIIYMLEFDHIIYKITTPPAVGEAES